MMEIIKKQLSEYCSDPKLLIQRIAISIALSLFLYFYPTILTVSYLFHEHIYSYGFFEVYDYTKHLGYTTLIASLFVSFALSFSAPSIIYKYKNHKKQKATKTASLAKALLHNWFILLVNVLFILLLAFIAVDRMDVDLIPRLSLLLMLSLLVCFAFYGLITLSNKVFIPFMSLTLLIYIVIALTQPGAILSGTLSGFGIGNIPVEIISTHPLPFSPKGIMKLRSPSEIFFKPSDSEHIHVIPYTDKFIIKQFNKSLFSSK